MEYERLFFDGEPDYEISDLETFIVRAVSSPGLVCNRLAGKQHRPGDVERGYRPWASPECIAELAECVARGDSPSEMARGWYRTGRFLESEGKPK